MKSGSPMIKNMEKPWTFMSCNLHKVCQYYVNENHGKTMGIREFIE
jgi:hypothetical protein